MTTRHVGTAALTLCVMMAVAACGPGNSTSPPAGGGSSGASVFSKDLSGALKSSGFNPSDEVGTSRADYAKQQLGGVTVTMDTTAFDPQKFAAQAAAGQVPDLIQTDRNVVATLADKDLIIPLDDCYRLWDVTPGEQYYPSTVADVTYAGKVYGVPQFFQPNALIANKRVLEKAGVTVDQLDTSKPDQIVEVAKKLTTMSGSKPTVLGFDGDLPGSAAMWFNVFGGKVSDDAGKPTLDDPNNVKALTWMKQLMDAQGGFAAVKSLKDTMDVFGDNNQYVKDQVGVQTWAQWYPNVLANVKDEISIEAVPIKTLDGQPIAMAGGSAFAIPKAGKNPSAACAYAINVTSTAAWTKAGEARAQTVVKDKSINTGLFTASPTGDQAVRGQFVKPSGSADFDQVITTYYDILPTNKTNGSSAVGQQINNDLGNAVTVALTGEKDPATALADAQASSLRAWGQSKAGKG